MELIVSALDFILSLLCVLASHGVFDDWANFLGVGDWEEVLSWVLILERLLPNKTWLLWNLVKLVDLLHKFLISLISSLMKLWVSSIVLCFHWRISVNVLLYWSLRLSLSRYLLSIRIVFLLSWWLLVRRVLVIRVWWVKTGIFSSRLLVGGLLLLVVRLLLLLCNLFHLLCFLLDSGLFNSLWLDFVFTFRVVVVKKLTRHN